MGYDDIFSIDYEERCKELEIERDELVKEVNELWAEIEARGKREDRMRKLLSESKEFVTKILKPKFSDDEWEQLIREFEKTKQKLVPFEFHLL